MAYDLLRGKTRRNWARDARSASCLESRVTVTLTDEVDFKLTPTEMAMLADLASTKLAADSGDRAARQKIAGVVKKMVSLKARARSGDASAQRTLRVIDESGVFRGSIQSFSMGDEITRIPNVTYRAAVLKQACKSAGKRVPTTKDFFAAKKAVDKTMGQAGIKLFLPGSRPGRITY
jgi:hypothetical protein